MGALRPRRVDAGEGDSAVIRPADAGVDVLMITYNRAEYVSLSLPRLLSTLRPQDRVWLWHNGEDEATLAAVHENLPGIHRFHHSRENVRLTGPTNWLWSHATGSWLSKVDDDCLVSPGWLDSLVSAHSTNERFGVLGSWRFQPEDWREDLTAPKTAGWGQTTVLRNLWVQGSGYVLRREAQRGLGLLRARESWPQWCIRLARRGWVNGWPLPLVLEEHMDDPRSEHTLLVDDDSVRRYLPLSAQARGVTTLEAWQAQMRQSAVDVQAAPLSLWRYSRAYRAVRRARAAVSRRRVSS